MAVSYLLSEGVLETLLPRRFVPTADWATENILMPQDSKVRGNFRLDLFPHARGIFDALDDPNVSIVTVQTGAQIGKTTIAQAYLAKMAATNPHPMAWADADEKSTRRVLSRTWRMFERTQGLAHLCPPKRLQGSDKIETSTFLIHGAWTRSASSAADYGAYVVVLNETDKMTTSSTSAEADFRYLMCERVKGYVGAKILELSTPTLKGASYIEQRRLRGDNRSWQVPCPHCNHYQTLRTGDGKTPGGIRFEKLNGKLDPAHAEQTAHYECEACRGRIEEHQRYEILQRGVWVPECCSVSPAGVVIGTPTRPGPHASFGPLPTLCSLLPGVSIGKVAREFVEAITSTTGRTEKLRNFRNSWEGETFDPRPKVVATHELRARMECAETPRVCPTWSRFLTVGIDTGAIGETLLFFWVVSAWARCNTTGKMWGKRGHCVDHGITAGEEGLREQVTRWLTVGFPHADGGSPLLAKRIGIDAGDGVRSNRVYTLCETMPANVWPVKGSSHDLGLDWYSIGFQRAEVHAKVLAARRATGQGDLLIINTQRTQGWRTDITGGLITAESPDWYSIPTEFASDSDFLDQLIADFPIESEHGVRWERNGANEKGDGLRYSFALAHHVAGPDWQNIPLRAADQRAIAARTKPRPAPPRSSGRAFMPSDR